MHHELLIFSDISTTTIKHSVVYLVRDNIKNVLYETVHFNASHYTGN